VEVGEVYVEVGVEVVEEVVDVEVIVALEKMYVMYYNCMEHN